MSNTTLKVALIGAGRMAREHARAFKALPDVELVGIQSRTREKAESLAAEFDIANVSDTVEDLYAATKADLVVVAASVAAMGAVARQCLRHPWTIFLEKPPGIDYEEAEDLHRTAARVGAQVFVALNRRFYKSSLEAGRALEGNPDRRLIIVQDQQDLNLARSVGHPDDVVQRMMYANSVHLVDYLCLFGRGDIRRVEVTSPWTGDGSSPVLATVTFESGDIGQYIGVWGQPGPWAVSVGTARERWEFRPLENASIQRAGERQTTALEAAAEDRDFKPGFYRQAAAVVAATRSPAIPQGERPPTLAEAMETMRLIRDIYQV